MTKNIKKITSVVSIALMVMLISIGIASAFDPSEKSSPVANNITSTTAEITWATLNESDSRVIYGTNASQLDRNVTDLNQVINHTVLLENLTPNTTYYYQAQSYVTQTEIGTENRTLAIGDYWNTTDGWSLHVESIDSTAQPRQVLLHLWNKSGTKFVVGDADDGIMKQGSTWGFDNEYGKFSVTVESIFSGLTSDMVKLSIPNQTVSEPVLQYTSSIENFTTPDIDVEWLDFINGSLVEVTNNSATISWSTTLPSDSLIKYGTSSENYTYSVYDGNQTTYHVLQLTNLSSNTTYYGVLNSTNTNATLESFEVNFTTLETELPPSTPEYGVSLTVDSPAKNTTTNISATYIINLNNTGTTADTYNITKDNPQNAHFSVEPVSDITLNSNENQNILLNVTSDIPGTYNVSITATSVNDSTKNATIYTTTIVEQETATPTPTPPPTPTPNATPTPTPTPPVPPTESTISGYVINDINNESLSGWTVRLIGVTEGEIRIVKAEIETDSSGFYMFNNLPAGRYTLVLSHEKGYILTGKPVIHVKIGTGENSQNNDFTAADKDSFIESKKKGG